VRLFITVSRFNKQEEGPLKDADKQMKALSINHYHSRHWASERRAAKRRDRLALAVIIAACGLSIAGAFIR
jgi:hypothetical protein